LAVVPVAIPVVLGYLRHCGGRAGRDVSVHAGFGDILSNLNFGLIALSEVRHKKILLVTDLMWIKLSDDKALPENVLRQIGANAKTQDCHQPASKVKLIHGLLAPLRPTTTYVHDSAGLLRFHSPLCSKEHVELIC